MDATCTALSSYGSWKRRSDGRQTGTQLGSSILIGSAGIQDAPIDRALSPRLVWLLHAVAAAADSMDEPTVDLMPSSSVMEDSRALGIDAVDGGRLEGEQQITQVSYLIRSLCLFFYVVCFLTYSVHISQNTTSVTMGVETIGTISQNEVLVENEVPHEVKKYLTNLQNI